jgi:hypothetical protein
MENIERRAFMQGATLGALAFTVGGAKVLLTPQQARAQNVVFRTLTPDEVNTLEALGETLVPGAEKAGIAHFVDQQVSIPPEEALLEARIGFNMRPPYANFYRAALAAVDRACERLTGYKFATAPGSDQHTFVDNMRQNKIEGWQGPPAGGLVYAVLRADSVDVVYGTMEGHAALDIPYMAHIAPTTRW